MTIAEKYLATINELRSEITTVSIDHQTIAQRDFLDDLCTRRYKFADGSVLTEAIDPDCYTIHYGVGA
jgi:hypothetical protein